MSTPLRLLAAGIALALAACASEPPPSTTTLNSEAAQGGDRGMMVSPVSPQAPPSAQGPRPMPQLAVRVERVIEEVGEELSPLVMEPPTSSDGPRQRRRDVLRSLSPRVRASLRRHNVRVGQLARYLHGGNQ